jgi:hypothetical protein
VERPIWLAAVCGSVLILGCGPMRPPYPEDPLLLGKKPVTGKSTGSQPAQVANAEPTPPELSPTILASALPPPKTPVLVQSTPPADRAGLPRQPLKAIPTSNRHSPAPPDREPPGP